MPEISRHTFGPVELFTVPLHGPQDRRRAERDAVEALVYAALGDNAVLEHNSDGAPYIVGRPEVYISVSHSRHMAALALASEDVGIDIEEPRPQLLRVAARFLSPHERDHYSTPERILEAWTIKEAAYKAMRPGIPATRIPLPPSATDYRILYTGPLPSAHGTHLSIVLRK